MRSDRPSSTALLIARSLVLLSLDPRTGPLVPAETAALSRRFLRAASSGSDLLLTLVNLRPFRSLVFALERAVLPGMQLHYVLRKRRLEEIAREALAEGYRQVVVLGAGLDPLALRLAREFPAVRFLEVDHPATQELKRRALGEDAPPNLSLLPGDLAEGRLEAVLPASGAFEPGCPTLFIAEGLLMYLDPPAVDAVFAFCRESGGPAARLAFTFMERLEDGRIAFRGQHRLIDLWLRLKKEPFRWGIRKEALPGFLRERGFECLEVATHREFRERYLTTPEGQGLPLVDGDHLCLAQAGGTMHASPR